MRSSNWSSVFVRPSVRRPICTSIGHSVVLLVINTRVEIMERVLDAILHLHKEVCLPVFLSIYTSMGLSPTCQNRAKLLSLTNIEIDGGLK